jgi:hypothetical protein
VIILLRSLSHTDWCPQPRCLVAASKGGSSSASGVTSLQAADHLTPTSYFDSWLQLVLPSATSSRSGLNSQSSPVQSSKFLLALASTVVLGFRLLWDSWPYFVLSRLLRALKWGLLFDKRRGLAITGHCLLGSGSVSSHSHSLHWLTACLPVKLLLALKLTYYVS